MLDSYCARLILLNLDRYFILSIQEGCMKVAVGRGIPRTPGTRRKKYVAPRIGRGELHEQQIPAQPLVCEKRAWTEPTGSHSGPCTSGCLHLVPPGAPRCRVADTRLTPSFHDGQKRRNIGYCAGYTRRPHGTSDVKLFSLLDRYWHARLPHHKARWRGKDF